MALDKLRSNLKKISNPTKAEFLQGYFKTGSGEYGEGDIFIGITVPNLRKVAKEFEEIKNQRIMLRYAIEKLPEKKRTYYLKK